MTYQKLTFNAAHGSISGTLGEKKVLSLQRPAQGTTVPPPGNYVILPPVNDPVYGVVAHMIPYRDSGNSFSTNSNAKVAAPLSADLRIGNGKYVKQATFPSANAAFILSNRPILGGNSLVVTSGFADLMDALTASGGAEVTVI